MSSPKIELLRVLTSGPRSGAELRDAFPAMARHQLDTLLERMRDEGLVSFALRRWRLTYKGRRAAPAAPAAPIAPPMRPYVSPKVIRRRGSLDAARLPSLAAGRRYWPGGAS